jgi:hypothetical protein
MNSKDYIMVIDSRAMNSGQQNDGRYTVDFTNMLSEKYQQYTVESTFITKSEYYIDTGLVYHGAAGIYVEFGARPYIYDASNNSTSTLIGFAHNQRMTSTNASYFKMDKSDTHNLTISNPSSWQIRVKIVNFSTGLPLVSTSSTGVPNADMGFWQMQLKFTPVPESYVENM